ncbi:hypothetical protein MTR67_043218 [Solanum verrucosum]|uniref:Uncharacterized protein n=1 Tax=Solanum verrucosum TaxID=315347 RepID=A0AAF0ZU32_SOLVR|nr:hypothetical protein MTR67_043218 [Solanum verrucosum]
MVYNGSESSFVADVKAKQRLDPTLVDLKESDMTTQGAFASAIEGDRDDQGAPPHAHQAPQALVDHLTDQVTNAEFMVAFLFLAQAMMA